MLYLTVQDQQSIERAQGKDSHWTHAMARDNRELLAQLGDRAAMISIERSSKDAMVYYDMDALIASWSDAADVVTVLPGAFDDQTAVLLRAR